MEWSERHPREADARFDGGALDCGNGLLLLIRKHLGPLAPGGLLEILSTEPSVEDDLPSWSRLTGNELVSRAWYITRRATSASHTARRACLLTCVVRTAPARSSAAMPKSTALTPVVSASVSSVTLPMPIMIATSG